MSSPPLELKLHHAINNKSTHDETWINWYTCVILQGFRIPWYRHCCLHDWLLACLQHRLRKVTRFLSQMWQCYIRRNKQLIELEYSTLSNVRVIGKVFLSMSTVRILLTCFVVEKPSYGILCRTDGLTSYLCWHLINYCLSRYTRRFLHRGHIFRTSFVLQDSILDQYYTIPYSLKFLGYPYDNLNTANRFLYWPTRLYILFFKRWDIKDIFFFFLLLL